MICTSFEASWNTNSTRLRNLNASFRIKRPFWNLVSRPSPSWISSSTRKVSYLRRLCFRSSSIHSGMSHRSALIMLSTCFMTCAEKSTDCSPVKLVPLTRMPMGFSASTPWHLISTHSSLSPTLDCRYTFGLIRMPISSQSGGNLIYKQGSRKIFFVLSPFAIEVPKGMLEGYQ